MGAIWAQPLRANFLMNPAEEQAQELDVLESIYPDELTVVSRTKFDISINIDTASNRNHRLTLHVKYPPEYPNVVPELAISSYSDELYESDDDDDDEKALQRNINLAEQITFSKADIKLLLDKLNEEANLQIGISMIFALCSVLKDEAEALFQKKLNTLEKHREQELHKQELELSKKFIGTKVTKDSFEAWRLKFRQEFGIDDKLNAFYKQQHQGKMSGREIFENGLANESDNLDLESLQI